MEEEVSYSTVVFKNGAPPLKEKNEDLTVYSEVKPKAPAAAPAATPTAPKAGGEAAERSHFPLLLVCLGVLCVLLVAGIITIIYISVLMNKQAANLSELAAENQRLTVEKENAENTTEGLKRDRDDLNWTLKVILEFNSFPVNEYCPDKKCQPCLKGWILFNNKCYLFYNENAPWKTWKQSQTYCQNKTADLVIIDNLQEQEFISNHTVDYYDKEHGYFIGLHKQGDSWVWIDGRKDFLRYWIKDQLGTPGLCVLTIPKRNATESWDEADCMFQNKFICEMDALLRSN